MPVVSRQINRHRWLQAVLWAHLPLLALVGLVWGEPPSRIGLESLLLVIPALTAMWAPNRGIAASAVAVGLLSASGILVYYSNGLAESHFHFFVVISLIALYHDWKPMLVGLVYTTAQHVFGALFIPEVVLGSSDAIADPTRWALFHTGSLVLLAVVLMGSWRVAGPRPDQGPGDQFRRGFSEAPTGMALLARSGRFVLANRAVVEVLGYDQERLLRSELRSLVHPDDHAELDRAWLELGREATPTITTEMRCITAGGGVIWARISLSMIDETPTEPAMVVLQLEDATAAHRQSQHLEGLVRGKDEFVAVIGDEIRHPLGALLTLVSGAGEESPLLDRVETHVREISAIVDDLIVSAMTETRPVTFVARSTDVDSLCREAMAEVPGSEDLPLSTHDASIWADPVRAKQVLRGLIANAVRYGGPNAALRTTTSGPDILIQVIDDGPEIPEAERERIFSGGLHDGRPVTKPAAVGLGLTVGRHMARQMGGDIVYRRSPDHINVFELSLPSEPINMVYNPRIQASADRLGVPA
jgi:PAS domain S-box-containing protein